MKKLPFYEKECVGTIAGIGDVLTHANLITPEFDAAIYKSLLGLDLAKDDPDFSAMVAKANGYIMKDILSGFSAKVSADNKFLFVVNSGLLFTRDGYRCRAGENSELDFSILNLKAGQTSTQHVYGVAIENHALPGTADPLDDYFGIVANDVMTAEDVHPTTEDADVYIMPFYRLTITSAGITNVEDLRNNGETVILDSLLYAYKSDSADVVTGEIAATAVAVTQPAGTKNNTVATTEFIQNEITRQIGAAEGSLDIGADSPIILYKKANYVWCSQEVTGNIFDITAKFNKKEVVIPAAFMPLTVGKIILFVYEKGDKNQGMKGVKIYEINNQGSISDFFIYDTGNPQLHAKYQVIVSMAYVSVVAS